MEQIRIARKNKGWTQEKLAEAIGVKRSVISKYENGNIEPSIETAQQISDALEVPIQFLLGIEDDKGFLLSTQFFQSSAWEYVKKEYVAKLSKTPYPETLESDVQQTEPEFLSVKDKIAYYYQMLNTDGKLIAGGYFYKHIDETLLEDVADYVLSLSNNPLYRRMSGSQSYSTSNDLVSFLDTSLPQDGKDTNPPADAPERPPEGE